MQKYAKLDEVRGVEFAPKNKGSIINYNCNEELMKADGYKPFIPAETENGKAYKFSYKETKTQIKEIAEEIKPDPEEEARARRQYLDSLTLTSADVERAIYRALRMDFEDIKAMVQKFPDIDIKALGIELRAGTFERRSPYVAQIGALLGYTADDLDYLFENKELPEKTKTAEEEKTGAAPDAAAQDAPETEDINEETGFNPDEKTKEAE